MGYSGINLLVVHYFQHRLTAANWVFLFMAIMRMRTVTGLIFTFNLLATFLALKSRHLDSPTEKSEMRHK